MAKPAPMRPPNGYDHWVLDKRVNLAMVGAFVVFCAVNIGSYVILMYRVGLLEDQYKALAPQQLQIIRLEDSFKSMQERFDDKINVLGRSLTEGIADVKRLVIAQWPAPVRRLPQQVPAAASRLP